ncbi:hypothetical protein QE152_g11394 [Popillia japonica]|uniref:Uncharacterized protein n=1 Tax=Popillia japonica TaxID=7064 RepID=A0AAW1LQ54_POPJA
MYLLQELETNIQKENIHTIRDSELDDIDVSHSRKRRKVDEITSYISTTVQAKEVCGTIISKIKRRFSFTGHLEVANLFSVENFEVYSSNFPIQHLDSAISTFPFLDRKKFKTELEVIYRRTDFRDVFGAVYVY